MIRGRAIERTKKLFLIQLFLSKIGRLWISKSWTKNFFLHFFHMKSLSWKVLGMNESQKDHKELYSLAQFKSTF